MIYVLLLEQKKLYVGFSERPIGERFLEHFNYQGSQWTTLYRPVQVLLVQPGGLEEENEMTLRLMNDYGWWNVRGGRWCQVYMQSCPQALLEWQRLQLPEPLRQNQPQSSNGAIQTSCSRCGRNSHSVKDCYARTHLNGQVLDSCTSVSNVSVPDQVAREPTTPASNWLARQLPGIIGDVVVTVGLQMLSNWLNPGVPGQSSGSLCSFCCRCGRISHSAENCYARTHINGGSL